MEPEEVQRVLAHATRLRIYLAIQERPGISVSDVAREVGLYWTSVQLHVAQLGRAGLVRTFRAGRRRLLFPADADEEAPHALPAHAMEEPCRRVARAIVDEPGLRVHELCASLAMSERAVYHHLKRLRDEGLVESHDGRGYRTLHPTPRLLAMPLARADPGSEPAHATE